MDWMCFAGCTSSIERADVPALSSEESGSRHPASLAEVQHQRKTPRPHETAEVLGFRMTDRSAPARGSMQRGIDRLSVQEVLLRPLSVSL